MRIRDILRTKGRRVVTIRGDRPVMDAVDLLVDHNIGSVVVTEGDQPLGILTERDLLRLAARTRGRLDTTAVEDEMTRTLVTASPDDDLHGVMDVMTDRRIRHLPVLEGGRLVGIVSIGDLVNACRGLAEDENQHLRDYIHGAG